MYQHQCFVLRAITKIAVPADLPFSHLQLIDPKESTVSGAVQINLALIFRMGREASMKAREAAFLV
jgi:hypothetical protein